MPLIIALDGCDVTGKSFLASALQHIEPDSRMIHLTYRWSRKMHLYHMAAFKWALKQQCKLVIIDRWWPSEFIYAGVYRDGSPWPQMGRILDRLGLRYGVTYCITRRRNKFEQMHAHAAASRQRKEMYEPDSRIGTLHDWYCSLLGRNSYRVDWHEYNLDSEGGDVLAKAQLLYATAAAVKLLQPDNLSDYVGNARGTHLFVGERANPRYRATAWPFIAFSGASEALAEALDQARIDESECMWTNVESLTLPDVEHQAQLSAFLETYKGKIIALGDKAKTWLGNPATHAPPPPACLQRFKGQHTLNAYVKT